jgi:hypothetical protein
MQLTFSGGIGVQAIIWGLIDVILANYILFKQKEESVKKITKTVSRSIGLDIVFMIVGLIVVVSLFQDLYMVGNGLGVMIQGFFLFVVDSYYYSSLKKMEK